MKSKSKNGLAARLAVILTLCAVFALFAGCENGKNDPETTQSASPVTEDIRTETAPNTAATETQEPTSETTEDTAESQDGYCLIETSFAALKYPAKWQDKVDFDVSDEKVSFSANGTPVFDLLVNSDEGDVMGTLLTGDEESVYINIRRYDVEDGELSEMQDDAEVILQNLIRDYDFVPGEKVNSSLMDIYTSVVTLKYPEKWSDKVTIDVREGGVYFSCWGTPLFDIIFSECDGYLLGTYGSTPIYIIDYPVEGDELAAMQEDVNVILHNLMKDEQFTLNQN